ncbi:MAG: hypothetical protein GX072_07590 [Lysinibacillus sp.]|nr:hypothetical protein [Lysinibacillus sp.]
MKFIVERFPGMYTVVCTVLAFLIPFFVYKINERIHLNADPPWKKEDRQKNLDQ